MPLSPSHRLMGSWVSETVKSLVFVCVRERESERERKRERQIYIYIYIYMDVSTEVEIENKFHGKHNKKRQNVMIERSVDCQ